MHRYELLLDENGEQVRRPPKKGEAFQSPVQDISTAFFDFSDAAYPIYKRVEIDQVKEIENECKIAFADLLTLYYDTPARPDNVEARHAAQQVCGRFYKREYSHELLKETRDLIASFQG